MSNHKPCTEKTIDPKLVRTFLDTVGTQALTVEFSKTSGEIASRNGLLRAVSRLVGSERGIAQGKAMKDRGQVWLAKPAGGSSSFYLDRVHEIRAGGAVLSAK